MYDGEHHPLGVVDDGLLMPGGDGATALETSGTATDLVALATDSGGRLTQKYNFRSAPASQSGGAAGSS